MSKQTFKEMFRSMVWFIVFIFVVAFGTLFYVLLTSHKDCKMENEALKVEIYNLKQNQHKVN